MKLKNVINSIKPPCDKCPYHLGLIETLVNPCPQCKENGYQSFEMFQKKIKENDAHCINEDGQKGVY